MSVAARYLACAVAFGLYAAILLAARVTLWHDALIFPCILWAAMRLMEPVRNRLAALMFLATLSLAVGLAYIWLVGYGGRNHVFSGIFALSDAGEYYWDAERVLHGAAMNTGGARRPIFSAVLAGGLRFLGQDIRLSHVMTMLFWAFSGAFAVREVWRTHGHRAASIVFVLFILFARRYVGFVQSEGVGAPLGALAFGLLWRANSLKESWHSTYLGALLLQCVALLARPGPIFVILGIIFWGVRRAERKDRLRLLVQSAMVLSLAIGFQVVVRKTTTSSASFSDLAPILYGLIHDEDSQFAVGSHPWIGELTEPARTAAIWGLIRSDVFEHPLLVLVAPLRCLATWLYLPQGFFGFVWLNPDDRALENAKLVKQSMAEHGFVGPVVLWVQTLGLYSFVNAIVMAGGAITFVVSLLRATWRAWRARRNANPPFFVPVLIGLLVSLPFLPPWITEGAQILASVFFFVATFVVTSFLPARETTEDEEEATPSPRLALVVAIALVTLVTSVKLFPIRPPFTACGDDGKYLADVDRVGLVTYRATADTRANLAMVHKNNPDFADAISGTLDQPHRVFPAYDACHDRMLYVVAAGAAAAPDQRWIWLTTTAMAQRPLEQLSETAHQP